MQILLIIFISILAIAAILVATHFIIRFVNQKAYLKRSNDKIEAIQYGINSVSKYDEVTGTVVSYAVLGVVCFTTLFPFFWMIATSLKTTAEATNTATLVFFPSTPQWQNYGTVFEKLDIFSGLKNTLLIIIGSVPATLFISCFVAYGFEKMRLRHKTFWLLFIMSGLMIPYASVLLPQYKMYTMLNLTNTLWPFILPAWFGNVSLVFFFIQNMKSIPSELFEASKIDGAGYFKSFIKILLPNMKLPILTQGVFSFVSHWNDFFGPSIYLTSPETKTLQVNLYSFATNADKPILYAGAFITCIPLFIVYLSFQKFFVGSMTISGIKG